MAKTKKPTKKKSTKRKPAKQSTNEQSLVAWKGKLTDKQREIAALIMSGTDRKQTAKLCKVSVKTVDSHRLSLLKLLGIHTTVRLVHFGILNGIVGVTDFD